jgi:uncharacterized protein (TIGR02391 family)
MTDPPGWPSPSEALELPVDELAMRVLRRLVDRPEDNKNARRNLVLSEDPTRGEVACAYAEAWDWLVTHNLISPKPDSETWFFVTRRGEQIAAADDSLRELHAAERLGVDLHPRIDRAVGPEFILGRFEMAALSAMREVEIRVRELAGASQSDLGVSLMKHSFKAELGPLAETNADKGEQEATMALFWGAIGVFKNPSSHREVNFDDPTEAAEIVLLADLLMRILERRHEAAARAADSP